MPHLPVKQISQWREQIKNARCRDQALLLRTLGTLSNKRISKSKIQAFETKLAASLAAVSAIEQTSPKVTFPDSLPISQRKSEIAKLIRDNQVVIIAGETGSGKTTQLPKICLELGFGRKGLIGHTQPRRIAARTVSDRIAKELNTRLGDTVGYQVRFKDVSGPQTQVKLMTDGVLLAEIQHDRLLSSYEVLIIDEAHERSLNIDLLLGLLKPLCIKRPDLKVIITSATIDLDKFAMHFERQGMPTPVLEVSGRTYPVQVIYQAPTSNSRSLTDQISDSVETIIRNEAKGLFKTSGDILVFCAGEREIRNTAQSLRLSQLPVDILPLYSRLSVAEQNKVFQPSQRRKVVLATNVAETSLTVPGIAYVIDPGLARISRYSFRSKVQRLPIEAISQASANQRMGRCGRVKNGVCIRLYSEQDFLQRAEFTPAEILRSSLASVILKMLRVGIRNIDGFAFIDTPDSRLLNDGYKLLHELGAIDGSQKLTGIGRQMSDLPIDPRYAKILVSAQQSGCLRDALIVVSVLSIQDPRERPADKQQPADQSHQLLAHPQSEFFGYLYLWQAINNYREELSNKEFKLLCLQRYWSIARIFEWREMCRQLANGCRKLGWKVDSWVALDLPDPEKVNSRAKNRHKNTKQSSSVNFDSRYEAIHRALLCGLLTHIAVRETDDQYLATRSRKVHLFPGSGQFKSKPKWLMAAEFVETSRLFMMTTGQIKPQWVVESAAHLCRYSYSDPFYHTRSGTVKAYRKTLFYGLTLRDRELVNFGPINPAEARTIFIQGALVEGKYRTKKGRAETDFLLSNNKLIAGIEKLETKTRRKNLLVDDGIIFEFYQQRIPQQINNRSSFDKWLSKGNNSDHNDSLKLSASDLLITEIDEQEIAQFPDQIDVQGKNISIIYRFSPGKDSDGVTMIVPISLLAPFPDHLGDWLVPGLLTEKCVALIRVLPKRIRRNFAPAADTIAQIVPILEAGNQALHEQLADCLFRQTGVPVPADAFDLSKLDQYYRMNYRVLDVDGSLIEESRNLSGLKQSYADSVQKSVHAKNSPARSKFERHVLIDWDFPELSETIEYQHQGMTIRAFPMLKIRQDKSISLLISDDQIVANYHTDLAIIGLAKEHLARSNRKQGYKYLQKELFSKENKIKDKPRGLAALGQQLRSTPMGPSGSSRREQWSEEVINAALRISCFKEGSNNIRNADQFHNAIQLGAKNWISTAFELEKNLVRSLKLGDALLARVNRTTVDSIELDIILEDIKAQIYRLFDPTFLRFTSPVQLQQYPRYLKAIESRLDKRLSAQQSSALSKLQTRFDQRTRELIADTGLGLDFAYSLQPQLREFSILLEEWRVSLFAQQLRTQMPVSEKRLLKSWKAITK